MIQQPKTRQRIPKPAWSFSGLNSDTWRSDTQRLSWAQVSPDFKALLTVMINERSRVFISPPGTTENMQLGLVRGYEVALDVLRSLAMGLEPPKGPEPAPTYEPENLAEVPTDTD